MTTQPTEELRPTNPVLQAATRELLGRRHEDAEVEKFLHQLYVSVPGAIGATADVKLAVWGKLHVEPDGQPWVYDITIWGGPAYFGSSVGFMYTAYETWDAFFQNVTGAHVQGVDVGGGFVQVNWFNQDTIPVGQFNGAAAGAGLVQAGGKGQWQHT